MRIVFFTDYFRPEPPPPAHHIAERAMLWHEQGHDVTIVTNNPNYPEGKIYSGYSNRLRTVENLQGVRVVRVFTFVASHDSLFGKLLDQVSYTVSALIQALREPRPDVVVATTPHLFTGLAGALYARLVRRPLLLEVRDLWPDSVLKSGTTAFWIFKKIERFLYRSAAAVSVMTPAFEPHVLGEGARRATTIVGGTDLSRFSPGAKDTERLSKFGLEGKFLIGYPGTLGTAHDVELAVDAAKLLRHSDVRFLFIGGGPHMAHLRSLADAACPEMFVCVPTQTPNDMPDWWRIIDVGLVLLRNTKALETVIPSKIFEAMASAKPILFVGPRGAGSALVDQHAAGIVVSDGSPASFAEAALRLALDTQHYAHMSNAALKAAPQYSRTRHAHETIELMRRLIQERSP